MKIRNILPLLFFYFCSTLLAQNVSPLLQNFANPQLYNLNDTTCINISGDWNGEETEYINQTNSVKGKYRIKFRFKQEGNKVEGQSYIDFNDGLSFGIMKIRGMVLGNKFNFEEYEVLQEKFSEAGVAWCMRTGELDIKLDNQSLILDGSNYQGYATQHYFKCDAKVSLLVSKPIDEQNNLQNKKKLENTGQAEMQLHPNPSYNKVTVTFKMIEKSKVRIDIFTLSGNYINNIIEAELTEGIHQKEFDLSEFAAGLYLVRMQTNQQVATRQLMITR